MDDTQMRILAKKLNIPLETTKDPNAKLTDEQKKNGIELVLFKPGGYDEKGAKIGHYQYYNKTKNCF